MRLYLTLDQDGAFLWSKQPQIRKEPSYCHSCNRAEDRVNFHCDYADIADVEALPMFLEELGIEILQGQCYVVNLEVLNTVECEEYRPEDDEDEDWDEDEDDTADEDDDE